MIVARRYGNEEQARRRLIDRVIFAVMCAVTAFAVMAFEVEPEQVMKVFETCTRACRQISTDGQNIPEGRVVIHMIDVGQGDSVLVQTGNVNILIDAGERNKGGAVVEYLRSQGVDELDMAVFTHPHSDHLGGMAQVLENIPTEKVMLPVYPEALKASEFFWLDLLDTVQRKKIETITAAPGQIHQFGDMTMEVLWPAEWQFSDDLNDWSLAVRFSYGELDFLCCGDLTERGETQLLLSGANIEAEIIKSSHHGSSYSGCDEFLSAAAPELALISCGKSNDYDHPHDSLLRRYRNHGIKWKRTDTAGDIRVICENGKYTVDTGK